VAKKQAKFLEWLVKIILNAKVKIRCKSKFVWPANKIKIFQVKISFISISSPGLEQECGKILQIM
jgi:hypothetical protein